ncbi:hypothetical protein [Sphingomonas sp. BK036]|uniref:hypothetical protein n=1 Tax=Sphingomonas sp. BK036 TaxID=2512122 RepID=UPI00102A72A5|nr:hypothetical protein [Sphingomonas sp. BK036]
MIKKLKRAPHSGFGYSIGAIGSTGSTALPTPRAPVAPSRATTILKQCEGDSRRWGADGDAFAALDDAELDWMSY